VLEAIATTDLVVVPPSNPVVSVGTILAVPGIADALRAASAPIVGVSPIIGGSPVRGMADKLLPVIGVEVSAAGVARHYGSRGAGGLLDGWLVDEADAAALPAIRELGITAEAVPLFMRDPESTRSIARAALDLVASAPAPG
jgi:LPPG:FO 2-phospho-L-lactate transferase